MYQNADTEVVIPVSIISPKGMILIQTESPYVRKERPRDLTAWHGLGRSDRRRETGWRLSRRVRDVAGKHTSLARLRFSIVNETIVHPYKHRQGGRVRAHTK